MKVVTSVMIVCGLVGVGAKAHAGWLHDLVCDALKLDPGFWVINGALNAAQQAGALTSEQECLDLGDTINDFSIPDGTYKDCECESISWTPPMQPTVCSDSHDACTTGGPLAVSSSMMSCKPSPSQDIAGKVCASDPLCCSSIWDQNCVNEASTTFWSTMNDEVAAIRARSDLTCDQMDELVGQLTQEVVTDTDALPCLLQGYNAFGPSCETRSGRGHF